MGDRLRYAKLQENLFSNNDIKSFFFFLFFFFFFFALHFFANDLY